MPHTIRTPLSGWRWLAAGALGCAGLVFLGGDVAERHWFGPDDGTALRWVKAAAQREVDERTNRLRAAAAAVTRQPDLAAALSARPADAQALFVLVERQPLDRILSDGAITIYGIDQSPVAWNGRASPLPAERLSGPATLFVAPGPLGLRLVWVEPIVDDPASTSPRRLGVVAVEIPLTTDQGLAQTALDAYRLETSLSTVALRPRFAGAQAEAVGARWIIDAPDGAPLVEAELVAGDLETTRRNWRHSWQGAGLALVTLAWLLCAAPLRARMRASRTLRDYLVAAGALAIVLVGARLLLWVATPAQWTATTLFLDPTDGSGAFSVLYRSPLDFVLTALLSVGLVVLAGDALHRAVPAARGARRSPGTSVSLALEFAVWQLVAGAASLVLLLSFSGALGLAVARLGADPLHLSLWPGGAARFGWLGGILLLHAAVIWLVVLVFRSVLIPWCVPRTTSPWPWVTFSAWVGPTLGFVASGGAVSWGLPGTPLLGAMFVCAGVAWQAGRGTGWFRHGSQSLRLGALAAALIVPSLLLYPSLYRFAEQAREHVIVGDYAPRVTTHPQELQARLDAVLWEIDRLGTLPDVVDALSALPDALPRTEAAFAIWRQTPLARERLTSAVELYAADGQLASRFALTFPEYASQAQRYQTNSCEWEVFGEAAPFGAEERRMLHAERGICDVDGRVRGAVVVHVMLDYSALPFLSPAATSVPHLLDRDAARRRGTPAPGTELVVYGWGRTPIFSSSGRAWPLDEPTFARVRASREPFWADLERSDRRYRVYVSNDRAGIYAIGYPVFSIFDHAVRLAEVATLAAIVYLALLTGGTIVRRVAWPWHPTGRTLVREFRRSFYRKLALAFVLAAVIPVLVLAFSIRVFVATRLRADVEAQAARSAAVAQRVVEESLVVSRAGEVSIGTLDDDLMVWISRVIDQEVNVFSGPELIATSERDLVASGLLPLRAPHWAYRAVALDRLPSSVGEDRVAGTSSLMAAAPVSAGGQRTFLTVSMAPRQREIEREIDELDQGVHLGAVVFILLGAAVGFWMAERISDPVRRLTRASQRIAAGDLDTRVFVRSADELKSLVEAFNRMATELQRQRVQLERTNRLEAWADMARQVAHDIKNPLTPIQLSAEHLRRVHRDRGQPLSPVLETCIDSILKQVRLLRQIASEFSSFASTPDVRPVDARLDEVVDEVVGAYAIGLAERVALKVDVPADLPVLTIDRTLIGRAITNVLENALHAMPAGGQLRVTARAAADAVHLEMADNGVGMDEEAVARIFEPYFSTKAIGTGLGLTIARRNVELHGGTIAVDSAPGVGTTVRIRLPLTRRG